MVLSGPLALSGKGKEGIHGKWKDMNERRIRMGRSEWGMEAGKEKCEGAKMDGFAHS